MAYEAFEFGKKLRPDTERMIATADRIAQDYRRQGYTLTLRQMYYQFVSRNLLENTERSYKNLGRAVTQGRMLGLIDWSSIEDRGRGAQFWTIEEDPAAVLSGVEYGLGFDLWKRQDVYVEVWIEKEALVSVLERPCARWRAPYMACKGYLSASEAYRAGKRFGRMEGEGRRCVLIHLGDHDPSGIDMTRDNDDRLQTFAGGAVEVRRIALNMDQIEEHRPPPNPAKLTDSRAMDYVSQFGRTSWELDALPPSVIDKLVSDELSSLVDLDIWQATKDEEMEAQELLSRLHSEWDEVAEFLQSRED